MSIQLDGTLVSTTMRTPGHDFELAVGFCFTEGMLGGATGDRRPLLRRRQRRGVGVQRRHGGDRRAGTDADAAARQHVVELRHLRNRAARRSGDPARAAAADRAVRPRAAALDSRRRDRRPAAVRARPVPRTPQRPSTATATWSSTREDVGRHNAVDKVVGWMVLQGRRGDGLGLYISGRASIEMIQKAWAAGFSTVVSVSAPTALAVDAARRANLTLAGFHRPDGFNLYT